MPMTELEVALPDKRVNPAVVPPEFKVSTQEHNYFIIDVSIKK